MAKEKNLSPQFENLCKESIEKLLTSAAKKMRQAATNAAALGDAEKRKRILYVESDIKALI